MHFGCDKRNSQNMFRDVLGETHVGRSSLHADDLLDLAAPLRSLGLGGVDAALVLAAVKVFAAVDAAVRGDPHQRHRHARRRERVAHHLHHAGVGAARHDPRVRRRGGGPARRLRSARRAVEAGVELPGPEATDQLEIEAHSP